jgi:tRNA1Val (adenine37-N6)-methyltransferase
MPRNHSFRFKQFTIQQDRCAMKVCTDACVLGAWAVVNSQVNAGTLSTSTRILDIGTGTGLLSLMVAQRYPRVWVDAVELDAAAAAQARENVAASPFAERVRVLSTSIQAFEPEVPYDCLITNPPFYQSDLRSPDAGINQAHHAQELGFTDLLNAVTRLLKKSGVWNVLLPVEESEQLRLLAGAQGWVPFRELLLTHQPGRRPFRKLSTYVYGEKETVTNTEKELFIYETDGRTYSSSFRGLLEDFYLLL